MMRQVLRRAALLRAARECCKTKKLCFGGGPESMHI